MNKDKKSIFFLLLFTILVSTVGLTYAYFVINVSGNENANKIEATTGTLKLNYVDGPEIKETDVYPGWSITKSISVENTGTYDTYYSIEWDSLTNTIINDELVLSATCVSELNGSCDGITQNPIGNGIGSIKTDIYIAPGDKHTYTLTISFLEMSSEQNYNQNKSFYGVLKIVGSSNVFTLKGLVLDSNEDPVSGATVEVHSELRTAVTDELGRFEMIGVNVGHHEINVKNNDELVGNKTVSIVSGTSSSVSGNTIIENSEESTINVVVLLDTDTNINLIKKEATLDSFHCSNTSYGSTPYVVTYTGDCNFTETSDGLWKMELLSNGNFTSSSDISIDAFLVGGGGGGGNSESGGWAPDLYSNSGGGGAGVYAEVAGNGGSGIVVIRNKR